jgi:hypothetical protein
LPKKEGEWGTLLGAVALVAGLALVLEAFPEHFHLFFDLSLTGGTAFAFVVTTFFAGGFPALEHSGHDFAEYFVNCTS